MLLSLILTFASLDPSLQAQASTHVTKTVNKMVDNLGLRPATIAEILATYPEMRAIYQEAIATAKNKPATLEDQIREFKERAKALEEGNRKLDARLLESQKSIEVFNERSRLLQKNIQEP